MRTPDTALATDDYIVRQSLTISANALRGLRRFVVELDQKKKAAESRGHHNLAAGISTLALWLSLPQVTEARDPLPAHLAETGAALRYVLKGHDIIPDDVPDLGLADDELLVTRVLQRNPQLAELNS
jgi:uncharacterized membrane protein YkvA (DUF1232 family)